LRVNAARTAVAMTDLAQNSPALASGGGNRPLWFDPIRYRDVQAVLLALVHAVCGRLAAADIPVWLTGGTVLGALRHGGFVPHDDDVDLECMEADFDRIAAALSVDPNLSFRRGGMWKRWRVLHAGVPEAGVELDIFLREESLDEGDKHFPSRDEIFPLRRYEFNGILLPGPGSPDAWLRRCYGEDWNSTVRVWNHEFNFEDSVAFDPDRVLMPLDQYLARVEALGYAPPDKPPADIDEAFAAISGPGSAADRTRKASEALRFQLVQRRNQEEALAKQALREARLHQRAAEADDEDQDG